MLRRARIAWPVLAVVVSACGGARGGTERTTPDGAPCAAEDAAVTAASEAAAACRAAPAAPWSHGPTYDALVSELDAYERSLEAGAAGAEATAQALAAACWTFFDELAADVVDHAPLDVAEDSAEALLRDREHDHAMEAVLAARAALANLHDLYAAPTAPDCTDEENDEADAQAVREACRGYGPHLHGGPGSARKGVP